MVAELKDSYERLETMNRTLEIKVQERTRELANRNRDMALVLDNVNQGFSPCRPRANWRRNALHRRPLVWLLAGETKFVDYIAKVDRCTPSVSAWATTP